MLDNLKIAFIAAECVPYAKTGGLADVIGALPGALKRLGHEVIIILPLYQQIDRVKYNIKHHISPVGAWMGDGLEWFSVYKTLNEENVPVYFIEHKNYFEREGIYHDNDSNDYLDNPKRFSFLSRASLQVCIDIDFKPDIVHLHDWHSAVASAYLKIWFWDHQVLGAVASMLTIHNIGYQGKYPADHYPYTGLGTWNFTSDKFEDFGDINFLKGGIQYADFVTTVSPTYAQEIRTPDGGMGLAPYLNDKGGRFTGILNGVDYSVWDPAVDPLIPSTYSPSDLSGKDVCKNALQMRFNLEVNPRIPIIGVVSRFADQKGLDLLAGAIKDVLTNMKVQFAILGSGDKTLEAFFSELSQQYPGTVGTYIGYQNELSHWIEAGSDFFVMPSRYEPCGLNQIYSLKYATLPIVRATGGLDDTVEQYDETSGAGTGFKFWEISPQALYYTIGWAVSTYYDRPHHIQRMMQAAMEQDFSWNESAREYVKAYIYSMELKGIL
jgi:starch synthase